VLPHPWRWRCLYGGFATIRIADKNSVATSSQRPIPDFGVCLRLHIALGNTNTLGAIAPTARPPMHNDEDAIRGLVATWMAATKAGDTETVLGLMADDVVFLVPGQPPFGKAAFANAAKAQSDSSLQFDGSSEVLEVRVLGDWAFMLTRLTVTANKAGNDPVTRSGHTLSILVKRDDKWLLARDANLLAPVADSGKEA
jgi:uncharacterized protein (TIGR02246 family)